jgi:hypothetical protein
LKQLAEFVLADGGTVLVEVDAAPPVRAQMRGAFDPREVVEKAKLSFEQALDKIRPAATAIIAKLRGIGDAPDEVSVSFGIKLNAEAGAVIAAAGVEANYNITLVWKKSATAPGSAHTA